MVDGARERLRRAVPIPEILLAGVEPAISEENPLYCINSALAEPRRNVEYCPQTPQLGPNGGLGFAPIGAPKPAWPVPQCWVIDIRVPVRATRELRGTLASPCDCVRGANKIIDGQSSPTLTPEAPLLVAPGTATRGSASGGGSLEPQAPAPGGHGLRAAPWGSTCPRL